MMWGRLFILMESAVDVGLCLDEICNWSDITNELVGLILLELAGLPF